MKSLLTFFILFFFIQSSFCQVRGIYSFAEVELPLTSNPVIKEYLKTHPITENSKRQPQHILLSLPFIDDFSKPTGIYADSTLWDNTINGGAFINSTFAD